MGGMGFAVTVSGLSGNGYGFGFGVFFGFFLVFFFFDSVEFFELWYFSRERCNV